VNCRLNGRLARGRERVRVRIIDISEGGLCLLAPSWINPKEPISIAIEVPGRATATVQVEIWHIRREKSKTSTSKIWVAGAILRDADSAYAQLLEAAGLAPPAGAPTPIEASDRSASKPPPIPARGPLPGPSPQSTPPTRPAASPRAARAPDPIESSGARSQASDSTLDSIEPRIFRLHCKAKGSPRTRVLTIAADSEEQARKLAEADLGSAWDLLEVREA
jgi:hypothetical protein